MKILASNRLKPNKSKRHFQRSDGFFPSDEQLSPLRIALLCLALCTPSVMRYADEKGWSLSESMRQKHDVIFYVALNCDCIEFPVEWFSLGVCVRLSLFCCSRKFL